MSDEKILSDIALRLKREAQRKYNHDHPEKQKEYTKRMWEKKAQQALEKGGIPTHE